MPSLADTFLTDIRVLNVTTGGSIADNIMIAAGGSGSITDRLDALGLEPYPNLSVGDL